LAESIKKEFKQSNFKPFTRIMTFPRGGFPVACCLAHLLGIKEIITPDSDVRTTGILSIKDTLVVDDIIDSGKTLKDYVNQGFTTVVLVNKESSKRDFDPYLYDIFIGEKNSVQFPWECF